MNLHISKSKNAESFYICKSFVKANGSTSSMIVRKLGTLEQLLVEHGPTRDDVLAWAKNEVKIETEKYKKEKETKTVLIPFHADVYKRQSVCNIHWHRPPFFRPEGQPLRNMEGRPPSMCSGFPCPHITTRLHGIQ